MVSLVALSVMAVPLTPLRQQSAQANVPYLPNAHSHNDYVQAEPLALAMRLGFASVEADIFLQEGELRVGHDRKDLRPGRTLTSLYLAPLAAAIRGGKNPPYTTRQPLQLLVDIKADGAMVYERLKTELEPYKDILTEFRTSGVRRGPVTVVLSGDRPTAILAKEERRLAFIDGRLSDLEPNPTDAQLVPLISDSWYGKFKWTGVGPLPEGDRLRLQLVMRRAQQQRQKVRFWGLPDTPNVWRTLRREGVDFIGTDKPLELAEFLNKPD
ncbi:MAG: phosphatidylinositol-specific phospholipase C/glycerophosphodiester phosphodiesterase family protein [Fimbriimonadaceae bacterium]|nr:phosphatidylinositol-specific phospholipase C/glycerophosphodiester phosphodiesterase family protein [Fimbriimonadaceae bacterium]